MSFEVYILFSKELGKYYVGFTGDIGKRLVQHNMGRSRFTFPGIPWKLVSTFKVRTRKEAVRLEREIKKRGIKRYLEDQKQSGCGAVW